MRHYRFLVLFFICFSSVCSAKGPWFTGPLLAPGGQTIPKGHWNFEPYILATDSYGVYNNHWQVIKVPDTRTVSAMPIISYGLTNYMDVQAIIPLYANSKSGHHAHGIGDMTFVVGVQAYKQHLGHWLPSLRMTVAEQFPTGNYQYLNPSKLGVDAGGNGAFQTALGLNFQQLSQPWNDHYLRTRLALTATFPYNANVHEFNAYGGGQGTDGSIGPGMQMQGDLAFEYQLTQNWVPVFEVAYVHRQASSFRGNAGRTLSGLPATVGHDDVEQLNIAPAIEYNFNDHMGLIAGVWMSLTGKDSNQFITGAVAFNYFL